MAHIGSSGWVDDHKQQLDVDGPISTTSFITSSYASMGGLSTTAAADNGQTLLESGTYYLLTQWTTASLSTSGVTPSVSDSNITINQEGWYFTACSLSFSGSAAVYTLSLFENDTIHANMRLTVTNPGSVEMVQNVLTTFQSSIVMTDVNHYAAGSVLDVKVSSSAEGANLQLCNGNFNVFRITG